MGLKEYEVRAIAKDAARDVLCEDKWQYDRRALKALTDRVKKLEQYHCEHEFNNREKGCLESIFCSKCGALHPDWEWWGGMALPDREDCIWVGNKCYVPKRKKKGKGKKK